MRASACPEYRNLLPERQRRLHDGGDKSGYRLTVEDHIAIESQITEFQVAMTRNCR